MRILIVNDDGIHAKGVVAIAKALAKAHTVTVIAPDRECSGESHRLSFLHPIAYTKVDVIECCECYKLHGSPADCAKFGIGVIMPIAPDLLISGINNGENIGTDLIYSGTVNAAIEGSFNGVPSIAMSVKHNRHNYEYCCQFLLDNFDKLLSMMIDYKTVININFPSDEKEDIKGVKVCKVGERFFKDEYQSVPSHIEGYNNCYLLTGSPILSDSTLPPNDVQLWELGYITISMVKADFTDYLATERVKHTKFQI